MITLDQARKRVKAIAAVSHDSEEAHVEEDRLRHDVLRAISKGSPDAQELASIALTTDAIDFAHWYA